TVVELHARPELERPRRRRGQLPLRGQPRMELAVRMAADEVVVEVERDPDVVGRRAHVGIEERDVAGLGDDQLPLLRGLGSRAPPARRAPAGAAGAAAGISAGGVTPAVAASWGALMGGPPAPPARRRRAVPQSPP